MHHVLQSLEETLGVVRAAMQPPHAAVLQQQPLNFDNDDVLDTFIDGPGGAFDDDEDIPHLSDDALMAFLSSRELAQHEFYS